MYQVCLNTALTYAKNESRKKNWQPLDESHELMAESQNYDENTTLIYKAINQLSAVNKAIKLLYRDDLSYDEIADIIGMTRSNISVQLTRIRKELELIIQKHNKLNEQA